MDSRLWHAGMDCRGAFHMVILKKDEPINQRPLLLACALSFVLGIYAFTLPETRPAGADAPEEQASAQQDAESDVGTEDADGGTADTDGESGIGRIVRGSWQMISTNPVFFLVTFVAAMAMGLYFAFAALFLEKSGVTPNVVGPVMTIGQWIEIFFMLSLPWFLREWGMHTVLLTGIAAWSLRFALFSIGRPLALVLVGIAVHGICFDFFFAAGMINSNSVAPEGLTATAQQLYGFLVYGLGCISAPSFPAGLTKR